MSGGKRPEGVLPRAGFLKALELASAGIDRPGALATALNASIPAPLVRARNTVALLVEIGVLTIGEDGRCACGEIAGIPFHHIRQALVRAYTCILTGFLPPHLFQLGPGGKGLLASAAQLPGRDLCYPYALLEFDVFRRSSPTDRFWPVNPDQEQQFINWLTAANTSAHKHRFSLASLKRAQQAREEAGRRAEEWVVGWERRRLATHPFVHLVRQISDEDASAGFDIVSFDGVRGLVHDRFIEVKGHLNEQSFYWSKEEIEAARGLGMRHWLYLVDRSRMGAPGYEPHMIQAPVSYFVDRDPVGWAVTAQGLKFTRLPNP